MKRNIALLAAACVLTSSVSSFAQDTVIQEISAADAMLVIEEHQDATQGPMSRTLEEVVALGLKTNPEYGEVAHDRLAVDQELKQAKALYLPSIDLRADTGYESTDTPSINDKNLYRNEATLTLTQLLFDGYGTSSEINRQEARVRSAAFRTYETAEFLALDITEAFLDVLRQRFLLKISETNVQDHLAIHEKIQFGNTAGKSTDGDFSQAKARLALARANLESVRQSLAEAEALYLRHAGNLPKQDLVLFKLPADTAGKDLDEAIHIAMLNSPTLGVFDSDLLVAKAEYVGSGSTMYPKFDIELAGSKGDNLGGIKGDEERLSSLLVMRWNLYRGGGDTARKKEFGQRKSVAHDRRINAGRALEQSIRDTWAAREAAGRRAALFHKQGDANVKVVQVYKDQFSLYQGRTLLDVLDVQNELFVAHSNYVNAFYAERFANFRLLALQGNLLKTLGITPTKEAFLVKK